MGQSVLVIGAGITGVCIAEHLRRAGQTVTLVDRIKPGDPAQTSYGNAGLFAREAVGPIAGPSVLLQLPRILLDPSSPIKLRWSYTLPILPWAIRMLRNGFKDRATYIANAMNELIYDTVEQHLSIARGTKAEQYISKGDLTFLYPQKADFLADKTLNEIKKSVGVQWSERNFNDLKDRDPKLGNAYQFGIAYHDHGWLSNPGAYVRALADHFESQGGVFLNKEIISVSDKQVTCSDGTSINADTIVVATGAWSKKLTENLEHNVPLQGERGYHIALNNPNYKPNSPYLVTDAKFGLTPMHNGIRCAGTTEFAKLDAPAATSPIKHLEKSIKRVYPDLTWQDVDSWMGPRPTTVDSLPMIGRTKKAPNVIYAFGGQHLGLTMGPKLGQLIKNIVLDQPNNIDLSPYRIDRFD